jgi:hypothetical protein
VDDPPDIDESRLWVVFSRETLDILDDHDSTLKRASHLDKSCEVDSLLWRRPFRHAKDYCIRLQPTKSGRQ